MDERLSFFYRLSGLLGILGALALVGAVVAMTAAGTITRLAMALYLLAAVLLASFLAPRIEEIGELLSSRTARQGSTVVAFSVAVIGILVLINVVGDRYSQQLDITAARQFTLSDQTVKVIEQVNQPVRITAFFPEDDYTQGAEDLLGRYARQSPHVTLEVIDPLRQRAAAEQAGIRSIPVTVFELGEQREETLGLSEQDFTSALLKLTRPEQKKVYFLTGHNERDPEGFDQNGYSSVAEALRRENYVVEKLSLVSEREVAADAAVVVLAAPRTPLLDFETAALRDYLNGGGALLVVADPQGETDLNAVLEGWGVSLRDDLVVDPGRYVPPDAGLIIPFPQFGHRISSSLPATTVLSLARSLAVDEDPPDDLEVRPLLKTSDRAWGETKLAEQSGGVQRGRGSPGAAHGCRGDQSAGPGAQLCRRPAAPHADARTGGRRAGAEGPAGGAGRCGFRGQWPPAPAAHQPRSGHQQRELAGRGGGRADFDSGDAGQRRSGGPQQAAEHIGLLHHGDLCTGSGDAARRGRLVAAPLTLGTVLTPRPPLHHVERG